MATLVILGGGSLSRAICFSLAAVAQHPCSVVVVARSAGPADLCHIAGVRAVLSGCPVSFRPVVADLDDPEALGGALADASPDAVVLCASTQSPWERFVAPSAWTALVEQAGFGLTLPLQAELAVAVGRVLRVACPHAWYLNACFPDAVNPVLRALEVPVLAGIGNVATLAAGLQAALGLPDQERLAVLAHHVHLSLPKRPADDARVWLDGAPVADAGTLLAPQRACSRPRLNQIAGHAAALLLDALLAGRTVRTHLPGPAGRPGGYPVSVGPSGVALRLPAGVSEAEAVSDNNRWAGIDGVTVDRGRVSFSPPVAALLHPHLPAAFPIDQIGEAAARLHDLRDGLRKTAHPR